MIANLNSFKKLSTLLRAGSGKRVAYLPVGCTEQHGPILPLGTDTLIAQELAEDLCVYRERRGSTGVVYPALAYSPSRSNAAYPGSTTVSEDAFRVYVADVCRSLLPHGFDAVVLLCMHGPAEPSLIEIAFRLNLKQSDTGALLCPLLVLGVSQCGALFHKHLGEMAGKHADFKETVLLYKVLGANFFSREVLSDLQAFDERYRLAPPRHVEVPGVPMAQRSVDGVIGRPYSADNADLSGLSEALWSDIVDMFSLMIDQMLDGVREC